ncbi:3639_t:CDS:2 [Diversispora eburnea]|uniref:3639_t:CDS:1 n=1 Tax=Diversispora eburnea TaxID=1213867 RepID=A0A9N9F4F9_9GLOM|nr:3639_t:CDS:2 [Diversispora eburnea]
MRLYTKHISYYDIKPIQIKCKSQFKPIPHKAVLSPDATRTLDGTKLGRPSPCPIELIISSNPNSFALKLYGGIAFPLGLLLYFTLCYYGISYSKKNDVKINAAGTTSGIELGDLGDSGGCGGCGGGCGGD